MKNYFILLLILFVLGGCGREKKIGSATGDYVTVDARKIKLDVNSSLLLSDFIEKVDIIPLEFNEDCMIGEKIRKIEIHNNNLFLIESKRPGTIYRFDTQGNFLNKIGARGQGPQELVELVDFSINEDEEIVYLLDNGKQMIYCFDFDGRFVERIFINQYASRVAYRNGLFYLFRDNPSVGDDLYNLIIRNIKGEIEQVFFPSKKYSVSFRNQIFTPSNNIFFRQPMNDTIYTLDGASLNYAYFFDFGSYRLRPDEIEDMYMERDDDQQSYTKERLSGIGDFFQVDKWIYFNSIYKMIDYSFLYNINSQDLKVEARIFDDLEYMFYNINFYGQTKDAFIGVYDVDYLSSDIERFSRYEKEKKISSERKEEQVKKMKGMMRGSDPYAMNPWVLLYYLKKD